MPVIFRSLSSLVWKNMTRSALGVCFVAGGVLAQSSGRPEFEVATIHPVVPGSSIQMVGSQNDPGMIRMEAMSLHDLVRDAYDVKDYQVEGPDWTATDRYNITAKVAPAVTREQRRVMEQNLLAERFHLAVHREPKEMQVYALSVGRSGLKMEPVAPDPAREGKPHGVIRFHGVGHIEAVTVSFSLFADVISHFVDHPVVDRTGVSGDFSFKVDFDMDPAALKFSGLAGPKPPTRTEDLPSIFTAVQTLGLRLEPKKEPMDIIVIDHADKIPTEN
jgi:uncharacterized protein (TIGR03435 family)